MHMHKPEVDGDDHLRIAIVSLKTMRLLPKGRRCSRLLLAIHDAPRTRVGRFCETLVRAISEDLLGLICSLPSA